MAAIMRADEENSVLVPAVDKEFKKQLVRSTEKQYLKFL
jgi:hypothetical protein